MPSSFLTPLQALSEQSARIDAVNEQVVSMSPVSSGNVYSCVLFRLLGYLRGAAKYEDFLLPADLAAHIADLFEQAISEERANLQAV